MRFGCRAYKLMLGPCSLCVHERVPRFGGRGLSTGLKCFCSGLRPEAIGQTHIHECIPSFGVGASASSALLRILSNGFSSRGGDFGVQG